MWLAEQRRRYSINAYHGISIFHWFFKFIRNHLKYIYCKATPISNLFLHHRETLRLLNLFVDYYLDKLTNYVAPITFLHTRTCLDHYFQYGVNLSPRDKIAAIVADDNLKCISVNENDRIPIQLAQRFVPGNGLAPHICGTRGGCRMPEERFLFISALQNDWSRRSDFPDIPCHTFSRYCPGVLKTAQNEIIHHNITLLRISSVNSSPSKTQKSVKFDNVLSEPRVLWVTKAS